MVTGMWVYQSNLSQTVLPTYLLSAGDLNDAVVFHFFYFHCGYLCVVSVHCFTGINRVELEATSLSLQQEKIHDI